MMSFFDRYPKELTLNRLRSYSKRRPFELKVQKNIILQIACNTEFSRQNYLEATADLGV